MCGRFSLRARLEKLLTQFALTALADVEWEPRFNIAPTQSVPTVRNANGRELAQFRWGLIPSWSKDAKRAASLINARAETVAEKPSFRAAFKKRRCLIPADGYYEWSALEGHKQPFHIRRRDAEPFAFGGLWEEWHGDGSPVRSVTIITTPANTWLGEIHDRMPLVIAPEHYEAWLAAEIEDCFAAQWLGTPEAEREIETMPVSPWVNNARHEGEQCLAPPG